MATTGKIPLMGFKAAAIKFVTLFGFGEALPVNVPGLVRILDEATAHALLHDAAVNTAAVSDELTGRVEVRD